MLDKIEYDDELYDAINDGKKDLIEVDDVEFSLSEKEIQWDEVEFTICDSQARDIASELEDVVSDKLLEVMSQVIVGRELLAESVGVDYKIECQVPGLAGDNNIAVVHSEYTAEEFIKLNYISEITFGDEREYVFIQDKLCKPYSMTDDDTLVVWFKQVDDLGCASWVRWYGVYNEETDELQMFEKGIADDSNKYAYEKYCKKMKNDVTIVEEGGNNV